MKVAIFGAGTMGSGIAQVFAAKGHTALLYASSPASAQKHKDKLGASLQKRVEKGKMPQEAVDAILNNIKIEEKAACADCDLILETVKEDMATKKTLLKELDEIVKPEAVFASNTSSLSITEIGFGLKHEMVGMHFFNPAPNMKLIEVIAGANTSAELVQKIKDLSVELGKTPVEVNEAPGFVVNRILIPMINEAVGLVEAGVASVADVDTAMKLGANHPMGPLELGDLIGLDVFFENAGWEYTISLSQDGVDYTVIAENVRHGSKMVSIKGEAKARYIKFSRLDDSADTSTPHWFSIYEVYAYAVAEDEPEEPTPEEPTVENLVIPQDQWVISGHCTTLVGKEGHGNSPMVAAGGVDSAALLHQGSIALGEIDLSKYSKVVIMWGSDNGDGTKDLYAKNEHNRFALVNADKNMVMSPAEDTIIAAATYELHGWAIAPFEIDLTGIDYNGPVFLTHDSLAGGFALVYSIEFIA